MKRDYLRKRRAAFGYAFKGTGRLFRGEAHAQIHLCVALCVIIAGFGFGINAMEWCLVVLCIGAVFAAEAFNTALEKLADKVSRETDPLIGAAKDVAAGAVLILSIASVVVGLIIFLPKIFAG
ncbi:MAG: diacylglycerol kinase family protein [Muribaculaceae bacterium]|nr:diacylglycerol kinase family protein [Muribaculaceae bacterium]